MAESDRLESGYPGMTGIAGSNPALSSNLCPWFDTVFVMRKPLTTNGVDAMNKNTPGVAK